MNLPPMRRGAFANPNLAPSGATPDGASFFQGMQRSQQVANAAEAMAPAAQAQLGEQRLDALRQGAVALDSQAHLQNQSVQHAAAELANRHALNAAQQGGLPTGYLQQLAAMTRQMG